MNAYAIAAANRATANAHRSRDKLASLSAPWRKCRSLAESTDLTRPPL
jgi:hypothetical protein